MALARAACVGKVARGRAASSLAGQHVLSAHQFNRAKLEEVIEVARGFAAKMKTTKQLDLLKGHILGNMFFEPSTRTASSFHAAMLRLGGQVISIDAASSSIQKGETLEDTIRVMQNYVDVCAMRHPTIGSVAKVAAVSRIPVLNAGDGAGEHPTQALLDIFCMVSELKRKSPDNLHVTLVGDLKFGRTVHSLSVMLAQFTGVTISMLAPPPLAMPSDVVADLRKSKITLRDGGSLAEALKATDVLYMTRVQKERFASLAEYDAVKDSFKLTAADMKGAKKDMIVMHPLPRVGEITTDVDADPRAAWFREVGHGMITRMALLAMVTGKV